MASICLLVVAILLAPLTVVASWGRAVIRDTDRYVAIVRPLADDPAVQQHVAAIIADAVMERLPVDALVAALPEGVAEFVPTLQVAIRAAVNEVALRFTASDAFATIWIESNRLAHRVVSGVLTADTAIADLDGGRLVVDLREVVQRFQEVAVDAGLTPVGAIDLSDVPAQVVLADVEQLEQIATARRAVGALTALVWVLFVTTVAAAAGSVLLAADRRRALTRLGLGAAFAMLLIAGALSVTRRAFLEALTAGLPRPVAASFFDTVSASLRVGFRGVFGVGVLLAMLVVISGRDDFAQRWARPSQLGVAALAAFALLAREQVDVGYVVFILLLAGSMVGVLEQVRQRDLGRELTE